ncbi:MAG: extracellular solute-binding protein, partial [Gammaproteobacteria bacterium]|nr:extracellular solute-binding protein [Gammaproteobacteria bacterium]
VYGLLADGIALSADRKSLFIRLNPAARWHDGVPITTRDVHFSYHALASFATSSIFSRAYLDSWIESFEVINDSELVIRHRDVFTHSNLLAMTTFPVKPAHYYADRGDPYEISLEVPLGNGPYRITSHDRDHVEYERVKDYWARDLPVNRGRHNFDRIRYDVYRDATVAREAFRKGLFDLYVERDVRYWHAANDIPALQSGRLLRDTRRVARIIGQQWSLVFNTGRETLRDPRVREALTLAYDFEWQNRVLQHDSQRRALSYFAGSTLAATGLPGEEEVALLAPFRDQIPERVFTEPYALPVSTGHGLNRAVLDRSRQLLADAGWVIVDGRLQDKQGQPFTLEIATQHVWAKRLLLAYIRSLGVLGIDARLRLLETVQAVRVRQHRQFDMFLNDVSFVNPPMASLHYYFSSEYAEPGAGANLGGIRDPVVDFLIERARRTPDMETALIACQALDRILLWGFYRIPLNMPDEERFLYWDKFGRPNDSAAIYEYLTDGLARVIDTWWFDDVKVGPPVGLRH